MELHYGKIDGDTPDMPFGITKITFAEHETVVPKILRENLPQSGIPYNEEVFPEQIILHILATAKQVHSIITGYDSLTLTRNRIKLSQAQIGRPIESMYFGPEDDDLH